VTRSPRISRGSRNEAIIYALKLLSYRSRSRSEMIERLNKKGFIHQETERTVRYLQDRGFIEDRALAKELFTNAVERRSLGDMGIRAFLGKRGIDKELISETISIHTRDMEIESACRFTKKRLEHLKSYPDDVKRRRIRAALYRRGFSAEIIREAVRTVLES